MFRRAFFSAVAVVAGSAMIASAAPKDDLVAAAKKLADGGNYSWKTTRESAQFSNGSEGKILKDGLMYTKTAFGDMTSETYRQGDKSVSKTGDNGWMTPAEAQAAAGGQGRGFGGRGGFGAQASPAAAAAAAFEKLPDVKKEGDAYTAQVTGDGVRDFMGFGGGRGGRGPGGAAGAGGQAPPPITDGKATVKVWLKDGAITKYEYKVSGSMSFNGQDRDLSSTTTTEIKDVGSTKIDVPAEAKAKLAA